MFSSLPVDQEFDGVSLREKCQSIYFGNYPRNLDQRNNYSIITETPIPSLNPMLYVSNSMIGKTIHPALTPLGVFYGSKSVRAQPPSTNLMISLKEFLIIRPLEDILLVMEYLKIDDIKTGYELIDSFYKENPDQRVFSYFSLKN